jgi:hypothetical protein
MEMREAIAAALSCTAGDLGAAARADLDDERLCGDGRRARGDCRDG